jgi:hypothetical protein
VPRRGRSGRRVPVDRLGYHTRQRRRSSSGHPGVGGVVRPQPLPGRPTAREDGGRAMRLRLGVGACLLGWSEPGKQAKGGDAWWAAGRRAGPGRSASRPDRGSARATGAPAGPDPMTPVSVHPADLRLALPGVPGPRPAVPQPRRPAVPGARHRAAGGGAQPAVTGQGDGQGSHCPTTGAAMALTAGGRRPRGAARLAPHPPSRRWIDCPGQQTPPSVATGGPDPLRQVIWCSPTPTGDPASSPPASPRTSRRGADAQSPRPAQGALFDPPARRQRRRRSIPTSTRAAGTS